ncbi:MAG: tetratricopeptide repeat protein [Labilithrix sp.]|nr:tetratricopeptide repeat protein [Labilithrix sp.]
MVRPKTGLAALMGALCLAPALAFAAPEKGKPAVAPEPAPTVTPPPSSGSVRAAAEKTIEAKPAAKPGAARRAQQGSAASSLTGAGGRPAINGPKIPDALRAQLHKQLEARIDRDVAQIRQLRGEAIGLLSTFVAETPREAREMPEAMLRLGELKWELEREQFVDRFKAWEAKPVDQRGPVPEPNFQPSRDLFARVLKDYPWFGQYDLALYIDGFLAYEQGKQDEALARFDRILKEHPSSRFVPDAHMARAEALFNGKYDYAGALAEYEQVLRFKNSDLYGLAMFKSAWCLWRLGRSDEAAKRFVAVFEITDSEGKKVSAVQRKQLDELQSEALKYLVEVFTEDEKNTAQDVYGFLTKIGGDRFAGKVVRALAVQFYDQAHYDRGIEAYELLLKLEPASPDAGKWVLAIAQGYNAVEDWPKLKTTYDRAVTGYTAGSPWAKTQGDPKVVAETSQEIERQLKEHALQLHAKAQRDKTSRAEFEGAAGLYGVYLSKFGGEKDAYQIQYYLAEIYFYRLDRPTDAATHYMAAARGIPSAAAEKEPLKTLRHDAIYNAIAALERVRFAELEARKKQRVDEKGGSAFQETEADKKFAEALELYAQLYPNDPALPELFFRQGRQYYDYGVYDAAVKIWGSLLEKFPRSQYALSAGELILDSFNRAKNYENIETWARRLKTTPAFAGETNQKKLDTLIVQAVFKQGEQKSQAGDHLGAAKAYLRAAKEFPKDPRAAQACVNSELAAQKAGDHQTLKEGAQLITGKDYRDRPESPQGAWIAATTFQSMGLFAESAEFHEAIAGLADKEHPHYLRFEHAKDAAFNAVVLRVATGEHDKAIANGNRYLQSYGSSSDADEVVFQMGKAHQNAGRNKEAVDLYRRYVARSKNQDHRVQGYVLLAQALVKNGDEKAADDALRTAVDIGKHRKGEIGPDGKYAAAHARYMEGERVLARFDAIQISGDVKQLSQRLKQKAELLAKASNVFLDVVSLGVAEWTTAALYQIGRTYENFAKALRDSPAPSGLSDADKEQYQTQIDEFVVPIEERSLDAYENGWKKATDLNIYNQWTAKMREALGRLNGELYPPFRETGFEVRSQGPMPLPALLDGPRRGPADKADKADKAGAKPAASPAAPSPKAAAAPAPAPAASKPAAPASAPAPKKDDKPAAPASSGGAGAMVPDDDDKPAIDEPRKPEPKKPAKPAPKKGGK